MMYDKPYSPGTERVRRTVRVTLLYKYSTRTVRTYLYGTCAQYSVQSRLMATTVATPLRTRSTVRVQYEYKV